MVYKVCDSCTWGGSRRWGGGGFSVILMFYCTVLPPLHCLPSGLSVLLSNPEPFFHCWIIPPTLLNSSYLLLKCIDLFPYATLSSSHLTFSWTLLSLPPTELSLKLPSFWTVPSPVFLLNYLLTCRPPELLLPCFPPKLFPTLSSCLDSLSLQNYLSPSRPSLPPPIPSNCITLPSLSICWTTTRLAPSPEPPLWATLSDRFPLTRQITRFFSDHCLKWHSIGEEEEEVQTMWAAVPVVTRAFLVLLQLCYCLERPCG